MEDNSISGGQLSRTLQSIHDALAAYQLSVKVYRENFGTSPQAAKLLEDFIAKTDPSGDFVTRVAHHKFSDTDRSVDVPTQARGGASADANERWADVPLPVGSGANTGGLLTVDSRERVQPLPTWGEIVTWGRANGYDLQDTTKTAGTPYGPTHHGGFGAKADPALLGLAARVFQKIKTEQPKPVATGTPTTWPNGTSKTPHNGDSAGKPLPVNPQRAADTVQKRHQQEDALNFHENVPQAQAQAAAQNAGSGTGGTGGTNKRI
jgi:hypothetical protein